jgi:hypothetical protein
MRDWILDITILVTQNKPELMNNENEDELIISSLTNYNIFLVLGFSKCGISCFKLCNKENYLHLLEI